MNNDTILLSIVIPTLNRRTLLAQTLREVYVQVEPLSEKVELLVSDNASDDGTRELFLDGGEFSKYISYRRFEERLNIDESFARSYSLSEGKFVLLFGDDDIPLPGFVSHVVSVLERYSEVGFVYVNRIIGDINLCGTTEVPHADKPYGIHTLDLSTFIRKFTDWPGFVSCLIFSRKSWDEGEDSPSCFDGYNFLARVYAGSAGRMVLYLGSPLVLQRRGVQSWKRHWPRYCLVSVPRLLSWLENRGLTSGALDNWLENNISTKRFFIDCLVASAYGYQRADSFWQESRSYQRNQVRKLISWAFQYVVPSSITKFIYSQSKKMT